MSEVLRDSSDGLVIRDTAKAIRPSAVQYQVGGRSYTMKSVPNCRTCQSHYRQQIEQSILNGYGYAGIVHHLPDDAGLNERNIGDHVRKGHLPLAESVRHQIIEERAKELGKTIENLGNSAVDHVVFARMGVQKAFEDIQQGKQEVSVTEAIQMANLLMKTEQFSQGTEVDNFVVMQGFATMLDILRTMLSPSDFKEFGDKLGSTPFLKSLMGQQQQEVIEIED